MDIQPYHKETEKIFWGESHIRNWLNKNFMEAAFISQEQQMIEAMKRLNVADNKMCIRDRNSIVGSI